MLSLLLSFQATWIPRVESPQPTKGDAPLSREIPAPSSLQGSKIHLTFAGQCLLVFQPLHLQRSKGHGGDGRAAWLGNRSPPTLTYQTPAQRVQPLHRLVVIDHAHHPIHKEHDLAESWKERKPQSPSEPWGGWVAPTRASLEAT